MSLLKSFVGRSVKSITRQGKPMIIVRINPFPDGGSVFTCPVSVGRKQSFAMQLERGGIHHQIIRQRICTVGDPIRSRPLQRGVMKLEDFLMPATKPMTSQLEHQIGKS
ncbi:hypothetical protein HZ994_06070 [Akkermansiaceae bacterium]|nr:hypothetical protein HZ994_06070 [Akkermansiaceae bacterium]